MCTHGNAGAIGGVGVTLQLFSTQPPRAARIFLEQSVIFIVIISFLSDYKKQEKNLNAYHSCHHGHQMPHCHQICQI